MDWSDIATGVLVASSTLGAVWLQNRHTGRVEERRFTDELRKMVRVDRQVAYVQFLNTLTLLPHTAAEHLEAGAKDLGTRAMVRHVLQELNQLKLIASSEVAKAAEESWHAFVASLGLAAKELDEAQTGSVSTGALIAKQTELLKPLIDRLAEVMRRDLGTDVKPN
jgi:hypothetical protein